MLGTTNPFNDPKFKKELLGNAAGNDSDLYEVIQPEEVDGGLFGKDNLKSVISTAPRIPGAVKNVIHDASAIAKNSKDAKAAEMSIALNDIFTQYNKEYNTNLQIDFSNLSRTLVNVSDPKTRHTLELYLSEVFQSIRPVLILHMISKLTIAIDYILDPQRMLGGDMTIQDTFIAVEKIMQFIQQLEDMKRDVIIKGSDLELKKIADEIGDSDLSSDSQQAVADFMNLFVQDSGINV